VEADRDGYDDQDRDGDGDEREEGGGGRRRAIENGKELGRDGEEE
jgi:hypothetical protein